MTIIINKQTDNVVVTKTSQEVVKVATGIKGDTGDTGATGATGPQGPTGDPGVYVGATPPTDTSLLWVDTASSIGAGSGTSLSGIADESLFPSLNSSIINTTSSLTGWATVNAFSNSTSVDATEGVGKEAVVTTLAAGTNNSSLTSKFYLNLSSPLTTTGACSITSEIKIQWQLHVYGIPPPFQFVAATGLGLTGTLYTCEIPFIGDFLWYRVNVTVPLGATIRSIGVKSFERTGGYLTDGYRVWLRDVSLDIAAPYQTAQVNNLIPVVTEASSSEAYGYLNPVTTTPRFDLRRDHALLAGAGGWWDTREWNIPESGLTDVSDLVNQMLSDLPEGAHVRFPRGKAFLVKKSILIRKPVTIDFNESILYDNTRRSPSQGDFLEVNDYVSNVKLLNGRIYGTWWDVHDAYSDSRARPAFVTIAGSPTTTGSSVVLSSIGTSVEYRPVDLSGNAYLRWLARHYEPDYGVINRYDVSLVGDGQSSVTISIVTDKEVTLTSSVVSPSTTESTYTLRCAPDNSEDRLFLRVTKTSGVSDVSITTFTPWGLTQYDPDWEGSNGLTVYDASNVLVENWEIENTGGEGIVCRSFNQKLGNITFKKVTCRGNHTQNYAPTSGRAFLFDNCHSECAGRTGFDIEPYAEGWLVDGVKLINCTSTNDRNYSISCNNWFWIRNLVIENFVAREHGFGSFIGGSVGGRITGFTSRSSVNTFEYNDMDISADSMLISNLDLAYNLTIRGGSVTIGGVTYQAGFNKVSNFKLGAQTETGVWPQSKFTCYSPTTIIEGGAPDTFSPVPTSISYAAAAEITGRPPLLGLDLGKWRTLLPQLYKGVAVDGLWWPYGITADEGLVKTEGISTTSVKAKNLRGIGKQVPTGGTASTVVFEVSDSPANFRPSSGSTLTITRATFTGPNAVTFAVGTQYYYAVCAAVEFDDYGHRPAVATASPITMSAADQVYLFSIKGAYGSNIADGTVVSGLDLYRGSGGSASGGPWDTKYRLRPSNAWFSTSDSIGFWDAGSSLVSLAPLHGRTYGVGSGGEYSELAPAQTGTWTLSDGPFTDSTGYEYDTNYSVVVTPSWVTTVAVTAKRRSGFDVSFGTPAPAEATFDWVLIR